MQEINDLIDSLYPPQIKEPNEKLDSNSIPSLQLYIDYYKDIEVAQEQLTCIEEQISNLIKLNSIKE